MCPFCPPPPPPPLGSGTAISLPSKSKGAHVKPNEQLFPRQMAMQLPQLEIPNLQQVNERKHRSIIAEVSPENGYHCAVIIIGAKDHSKLYKLLNSLCRYQKPESSLERRLWMEIFSHISCVAKCIKIHFAAQLMCLNILQ